MIIPAMIYSNNVTMQIINNNRQFRKNRKRDKQRRFLEDMEPYLKNSDYWHNKYITLKEKYSENINSGREELYEHLYWVRCHDYDVDNLEDLLDWVKFMIDSKRNGYRKCVIYDDCYIHSDEIETIEDAIAILMEYLNNEMENK